MPIKALKCHVVIMTALFFGVVSSVAGGCGKENPEDASYKDDGGPAEIDDGGRGLDTTKYIPWQGINLPTEGIGPATEPFELTDHLVPVFVSPNGSDPNGKGTMSAPFRTIKRGLEERSLIGNSPNAYIILAEGNYTEKELVLAPGKHIICGFFGPDWARAPEIHRSRITANLAVMGNEILDSTIDGCDISTTTPIAVKGSVVISNNIVVGSGGAILEIQGTPQYSMEVSVKNNTLLQPAAGDPAGTKGIVIDGNGDLSIEIFANHVGEIDIVSRASVRIEKNFIKTPARGITCVDCGSDVSIERNIIEISSNDSFNGGSAVEISTSFNQPSKIRIVRNIVWLDAGATLIDQFAFSGTIRNLRMPGNPSAGEPVRVELNTIYAPDANANRWLYRGYTDDLAADGLIYPSRLDLYIERGSPLWQLNENSEVNIPEAGIRDNVLLAPPVFQD